MVDIYVRIALSDHGTFLRLRQTNKLIRDELASHVDLQADISALLSRGDICSVVTRSAEFVPTSVGALDVLSCCCSCAERFGALSRQNGPSCSHG